MSQITLILATLFSLASTSVIAQDYEKGFDAYDDGDFVTALQEWTPLAEAGDANAQNNLGVLYYKGHGVPQNYADALKWSRLAAAQGHADAQSNLGVMYYNGQGVLEDYVMAHMWYNIASANGDGSGGTYRDKIAKEMTSADISKAQAMARECMSSGYKKCGY